MKSPSIKRILLVAIFLCMSTIAFSKGRPPVPGPPPPPGLPIDSGIILLVSSGILYGAYKIKKN